MDMYTRHFSLMFPIITNVINVNDDPSWAQVDVIKLTEFHILWKTVGCSRGREQVARWMQLGHQKTASDFRWGWAKMPISHRCFVRKRETPLCPLMVVLPVVPDVICIPSPAASSCLSCPTGRPMIDLKNRSAFIRSKNLFCGVRLRPLNISSNGVVGSIVILLPHFADRIKFSEICDKDNIHENDGSNNNCWKKSLLS